MWNRSSTYQMLLKFSKKDIIAKESKVKDQIRKIASQKKHPRKNLRIWVYTNHMIFLKELSRLQKLHFPVKGYTEGYFWLSLEEHLLQASFPVFFSRRKYTAKNPHRNSVNENSSKVRRNTSPQERWKNYAKRRQWQTYTKIGKVNMLANTQNSIIINRGKDLKISKNKFNRYGGQARSSTSEKNISTVLIVGKFAIEQLGCWTSLFQHFGSSSRM